MTQSVTLDAEYLATEDAVESRLGEETVLLHLESGLYFGLDAVGTRVWELLRDGASPNAICDTLRGEFTGAGDSLEADILGFLGHLEEHKLIDAK